jgi:predicted anti-sigma-YlaC factor YlaD
LTCRNARRAIIGSESHEGLDRELDEHLARCPDCRAIHERLTAVAANARIPDAPADRALTSRIMTAVRSEASFAAAPEVRLRLVRLPGWTAGGAVILASLVLVQFSDVVSWLSAELGSVVDVALGVMLGIALTAYIMLLVGSNLQAVRRIIRPRA